MANPIEYDDDDVRKALRRLISLTGDASPALLNIGEILVPSTRRRFETKTGPDGEPWERNSEVTIARKGRDNPLFDHGDLRRENAYEVIGNDTLEVYNTLPYAAMQHFGGTKAEFPWLWGDIPARPFLGISDDDKDAILDEIQAHIEAAL
jgi:phage virion morphogenesis protein